MMSDELFLRNDLTTKVQPYFQQGPLLEILNFENLHNPEFCLDSTFLKCFSNIIACKGYWKQRFIRLFSEKWWKFIRIAKQETLFCKLEKLIKYAGFFYFPVWVFFHEHSRFTGQQGKGRRRGGGYPFNSSLPLPPASQTFRH